MKNTEKITLWCKIKEPVVKEPVYWNDFTLWDTAARYSRCEQKLYSIFFLVPVRKIISVHEIYSETLFQPTISTFKSKFRCFGVMNHGGLSIWEGRTKRWEERFRSIPGKHLLNTSKIHSRVWWTVSQFSIKIQYNLLNPGLALYYCHSWTLPEIHYDPAAE